MLNSNYRIAFAKAFDYAFCFLTTALLVLLTPLAADDSIYLQILIATPFLWIIPEAALLSTWGATPGSLLMAISPRTSKGDKLSFIESLRLTLFLHKGLSIQWIRSDKGTGSLIKRCIVGCFIALAAVFGKAAIQFPEAFEKEISTRGWVHYTSSEGDFTADFPSKPKVEQKQLEIPQANRTVDYQEVKSSHQDQITYSVSAIDLPKKMTFFGSNTILKGALSVVQDNLHAKTKLVSKKLTKHGNYPAIDFHLLEGMKDVKGRLVLVGNKLFKIEFVQPFDVETEEAGLAFISSFQPLT
jgi:hypothetical protein